MKLFVLPEDTLNNVLAYLGTRPLNEVANLYNAVQKKQLLVNADGTPLEQPETPLDASLPETDQNTC